VLIGQAWGAFDEDRYKRAVSAGALAVQAPRRWTTPLEAIDGDILREAGRHADAAPCYRAILDDPAATAYDRKAAHRGLARCAVAASRPGEARGHAAVALAEPLGDDNLCTALEALVAACRAAGDPDAARHAADRYVDAARRIGGHLRPYYAVRAAVDVALDRADPADLDAARDLLADLARHAAALDKASGTTRYTAWAAERHRRLAEVEDAQQGQTPGYAAG
jgi:hypothetical protein